MITKNTGITFGSEAASEIVETAPGGHEVRINRRGLIEDDPSPAAVTAPRPLIRRHWSAEEAQDWTREDCIAIVLSPMGFAGIMFGLTKVLLLQWSGLSWLVGAVVGSCVIYWVIDPKLRAVSADYEAQQGSYINTLERRLRWKDDDREG